MGPAAKWISIAVFLVGQALAQQPAGAVLAGRVTDTSGKPIAKATLLLTGSATTPGQAAPQPYRATTAADGSYSMAGIEPGWYNLQAVRGGYAPQASSAANFFQTGRTLKILAGQNLPDVNFALAPAATISGTVVDENGDPVSDAEVSVWRRYDADDGTHPLSRVNLISGPVTSDAVTDNEGKYEAQNIAPGTYYVSAGLTSGGPRTGVFDVEGLSVIRNSYLRMQARPHGRPEGYLTTWYPQTVDSNPATPVEVAGGSNIRIDIQLKKTPLFSIKGRLVQASPILTRVEGRQIGSPPAPPSDQLRMTLLTSDGQFMPNAGGIFDPRNDTFEVNGLPPGDYYLMMSPSTSGSPPPLARQKFTIGDQDIEDLVVTLPVPAEIHGTLTIDGKPGNAGLQPGGPTGAPIVFVQFTPVEFSSASGATAPVGGDGSFTLPGIVPGAYRVRAYPPRGLYVKSLSIGGIDAADSVITLGSGPATMQVAFATATGGIRVNIQPDANGMMANKVFVVPAAPTPGVSWRYQDYLTAKDGPYVSITDLPPGSYQLFAVVSADMTFDADLFKQDESQSVKVTVAGNEPVTATLRAISGTGGGQ